MTTWTLAQYEALLASISPASSVKSGDKAVTYRSVSELAQLLLLMETALGIRPTPVRQIRMFTRKGC